MLGKFVFVREHASVPFWALLYQGPYLVLEKWSKFFRLQLGSRADVISVDRLRIQFLKPFLLLVDVLVSA